MNLDERIKKIQELKARIKLLSSKDDDISGVDISYDSIQLKKEYHNRIASKQAERLSNNWKKHYKYFNEITNPIKDDKTEKIRLILQSALDSNVKLTRDELNIKENGSYLFMLAYKNNHKVKELWDLWEKVKSKD